VLLTFVVPHALASPAAKNSAAKRRIMGGRRARVAQGAPLAVGAGFSEDAVLVVGEQQIPPEGQEYGSVSPQAAPVFRQMAPVSVQLFSSVLEFPHATARSNPRASVANVMGPRAMLVRMSAADSA
jgi:hypothetical protein